MADDNQGTNAEFYARADGRVGSRAFFSEQFVIADNDFEKLKELPENFGFILVTAEENINSFAILLLQPSAISIAFDPFNAWSTGLGTPTGTSGPDGQYNLFTNSSGEIFIENRFGFADQFKILLIN